MIFTTPMEPVIRNVVRGDGVGEASAFGVPFHHHLQESVVDEAHLSLVIAVAGLLRLSADEDELVCEVLGHHPVEGDVRRKGAWEPHRLGVLMPKTKLWICGTGKEG